MNDIIVSVFCLAYNHQSYIRKALEGFVNQKTNFKFEVLIHDDASTDGTADIIREYEDKYPEIIKPIYQTENQYSQNRGIIRTFLLPKARGKYLAWCEGDDHWTDENKLQKQVDFLEAHADYSCCFHKVFFKNLKTGDLHTIPTIKNSRDFSLDEIVHGGAVFHISSMVLRTELYKKMPECFRAKGFGDIQLYMYGAICGKVHVLSNVMSFYNHGTSGSWTDRTQKSASSRIEHNVEQIKMLERVNAHYDYKYNDMLSYAINRATFNLYVAQGEWKKAKKGVYRPFYKLYKSNKRKQFIKAYFPFILKIRRLIRKKM